MKKLVVILLVGIGAVTTGCNSNIAPRWTTHDTAPKPWHKDGSPPMDYHKGPGCPDEKTTGKHAKKLPPGSFSLIYSI